MYSIIKLLKALNSTQATFQLSLALVFGMLSGFLPLFSLINILIILIIFSLNIPLGVYALFTLLFTMIGSLLDSTFAMVGYDLLTNSSLNSFWTTLYNFNPALWFNFNHTVTLGSFVIGLLLSIPLYFISKPIFSKYRTSFTKLSEKIKIFKWFTPELDKTKKVKLFRIWGTGLILSIIFIISLFFILFFDSILKSTIEYTLSKATKSNITINQVKSDFKDGKIIFNSIQIINDNKMNTIDTIDLHLDTAHLLNKKLDIISLNIKNIKLDETIIPKTNQEALATKSKNNNKKDSSDIKPLDIKSILKENDLKSYSNDIKNYKKVAKKYYNMLKPYLPNNKENNKIIRFNGSWIKFKELNPYPSFAIQSLTANIVSTQFDNCKVYLSHNQDTKFNMNIINLKSNKLDKVKKYLSKDTSIDLTISTHIKKSEKFEDAKFSISSNLEKELKKVYKDKLNNIKKELKAKAKKRLDKEKKKLKSKAKKKLKDKLKSFF